MARRSSILQFGALLVACAFFQPLKAQAPTAELTFDFAEFDEVRITSVFNATITRSDEFSVRVVIDEDATDRVDVTQTGTVLNIALAPNDDNDTIETIEATVTLPVLERLEQDGVVGVRLSGFTQPALSVDVDGVSQLKGDALTIDSLTARVAGVSALDFDDIPPLGEANVDISGVSSATLNMDVGATLSGAVTGTSTLSYYGTNTALSATASGASSITLLGNTRTIDGSATFNVNAGLNGAWFNPATSGQGFFIDVYPDIRQVFLGWFAFDTTQPATAGTAEFGDNNHRWVTAQGDFSGNAATLNVILTTGGLFDDPNAEATNTAAGAYGTIGLTFENCNQGQVEYDLTDIGLTGTIPIQRLANDNVALCEQLDDSAGRLKR